jgi:Flp pilus assembly protein TadG
MAALTRAGRFAGEAGSELVEFALALPILLLVVGGILDFGLLFQRYEVITNAAREGARLSALSTYTQADVQARVQSYIRSANLNAAQATITAVRTTVTVTPTLAFNAVTVTVTYPYAYTIFGPIARLVGGTFGTTTLTAVAVMRSEL